MGIGDIDERYIIRVPCTPSAVNQKARNGDVKGNIVDENHRWMQRLPTKTSLTFRALLGVGSVRGSLFPEMEWKYNA